MADLNLNELLKIAEWRARQGMTFDPGMVLALLDHIAELEAKVARVEAALGNHPRCEKHPDDDIVTCGWKSAVLDVQAALAGESDE